MRKTKVCDGASNYFVEEVERVTGIDPPCLITSLPRLRRKNSTTCSIRLRARSRNGWTLWWRREPNVLSYAIPILPVCFDTRFKLSLPLAELLE